MPLSRLGDKLENVESMGHYQTNNQPNSERCRDHASESRPHVLAADRSARFCIAPQRNAYMRSYVLIERHTQNNWDLD